MTRSTLLAGAMLLAALAGCSGSKSPPAANEAENMATDNLSIEDVPSDSLSAPADMPLDSESNSANDAGGGNVM